MTVSHSNKALATLEAMATSPEEWVLTEIEWVEEEREVVGQVRCPSCRGNKLCRVDAEGKVIPMPDSDKSYERWQEYMRQARIEKHGGHFDGCPTCRIYKRGGKWTASGWISIGTVKGLVLRKVMVGYPKWPSGTAFDSRFFGFDRCHLCNKVIKKSGRVPVNTKPAFDGDYPFPPLKPHGMWVGEDCAKKFLNVKIKREDDSIMEDAK